MTRRSVPLLMILALVLAISACGEDSGFIFEGATGAGDDGSAFEGTTGTVPESAGTIALEVAGETWELPAAVCLRADGDRYIVQAVAEQAATTVRSLVGHLISGWPTTTYALSFDQQAYEQDLRAAGVSALTLAGLLGEQAALETAWEEYEQSYADSDQGWGPPYEISSRVSDWRDEAATLTVAVTAHCAAG
jgi:hypothetical protein